MAMRHLPISYSGDHKALPDHFIDNTHSISTGKFDAILQHLFCNLCTDLIEEL
jgi:hypothetical protein